MDYSKDFPPIDAMSHREEDLLKSLQFQLAKVIQQKDAYKTMIEKKDERIGKLMRDLETRDKILEMCVTNENEVYLTTDANDPGRRIFDIRNKEQVPFWIKTEQLSPRIHEDLRPPQNHEQENYDEDEKYVPLQLDVDVLAAVNQNLLQKFISTENDQTDSDLDSGVSTTSISFQEINPKVEEPPKPESKYTLVPKSQSSTSRHSKKRSFSPSLSSCSSSSSKYQQQQLDETPTPKEKKLRLADEKETPSSSKYSSHSSSSIKFQELMKFPLPNPALPASSSENVLEIPEIIRRNFGTFDFDYPIGLKFWFDPENSHCTKFFLKLHNDNNCSGNWKRDRKFTLIEQIGLCYPKTHHLNFNEILEKLQHSKEKRIWLDVRDFSYIFSSSGRNLLGESVEKSITHFSFGNALYSKDKLKSHLLLDFIFGHLPSLEYLSLNNVMICPVDLEKRPEPQLEYKLKRFKTLRLICSKSELPKSILTRILKKSPSLQFLYGVPLFYLQELNSRNLLKEQVRICSVSVEKSKYRGSEKRALDFLQDLKFLSASEIKRNSLEEFQPQFAFLQCKRSTFLRSLNATSKVLQHHENSIKKLKLEPFHNTKKMKFPRMKNLTTLQFDVNRDHNRRDGFEKEQTLFFPKGFDIHKTFPALTSIEISLDFSTSNSRCNSKEAALDLLEKMFPADIFKARECFSGVKSLKLHGFSNSSYFPRLAQLFPNIKRLGLYCELIDAAELLPHLYKNWPRLEQLHLEIDVDARHGNLDSALSGIDKRSCEKILRENSNVGSDRKIKEQAFEKYYKQRKSHSSIRSMKNLKTLNFVLRPAAELANVRLPIFSWIGTTAFSRVRFGQDDEKFKVIFSFDERTTTKQREEMISSHSSIVSLPFVTLHQ